MPKYKVSMILAPQTQIVQAFSQEEAIEIAINNDNDWVENNDYGGEDYEAVLIKEGSE